MDLDVVQLSEYVDRALMLVNTLYVKRFGRQELWEWVELSSRFLGSLLGKDHYRRVLDLCLDIGLIEYAGRYKYAAGHHAKHYRIGPDFRNAPFHLYALAESRYTRRFRRWQQHVRDELTPPYRYVVDCVDRLEVEHVPDEVIWRAVHERMSDPSKKKSELSDAELYGVYVQQIQNLQHKIAQPTRDEYGRLHTVLTNTKRDFRRYARLDGKRLVGWDIKTSQPLFLGLVCVAKIVDGLGAFLDQT